MQLVQLLLRHGANPLSKNADRESPLDVAATADVTRLLRSEIIASASSDDDDDDVDVDLDVRSPTSPESDDVNDTLPPPSSSDTQQMTADHTQLGDVKHDDGQPRHSLYVYL